jgi:ubiquinone/menaquinone biosynthesis C-methylase UbiE
MDLNIKFESYNGINFPYKNKQFNKIFTTLVFHHLLNKKQKEISLNEMHRVLKENGEIYILDFGKPKNLLMKGLVFLLKFFEPIEDNIKGLIPNYLKNAGFKNIKEIDFYNTIFGTISIYKGNK